MRVALEMLGPTPDSDLRRAVELERRHVLDRMGQSRLAEAIARRTYEMAIRLGLPEMQGEDHRLLGIVALATGRREEARQHFEVALEIGRECAALRMGRGRRRRSNGVRRRLLTIRIGKLGERLLKVAPLQAELQLIGRMGLPPEAVSYPVALSVAI